MLPWYRRMWASEGADGAFLRALGTLLAPAEWLYRAGVGIRSWAYDRNLIRTTAVPIPTLGVGNLTVGGTGKTPIAAWFAGELALGGLRPAIVLRGYGGDEVLVHRILNPRVPVYPSADRAAALAEARSAGCTIAVLDDAFQHRAVRVSSHVVLVAAEEWADRPRMLPRGPWREPPSSLRRADLAVVTRKTVGPEEAASVRRRIGELAPDTARAQAHIAIRGLARYDPACRRLETIEPQSGTSATLAVAGVARPESFQGQLVSLGVEFDEFRAFPDHHRYDARDIEWIRRRSRSGPIVTTLKDAVKLGPVLGPEAELRVGVQSVEWEGDSSALSGLLSRLTAGAREAEGA